MPCSCRQPDHLPLRQGDIARAVKQVEAAPSPFDSWFNDKYYPSIPYIMNLLMDPMEKMDPESEECGYIWAEFLGVGVNSPPSLKRSLATE